MHHTHTRHQRAALLLVSYPHLTPLNLNNLDTRHLKKQHLKTHQSQHLEHEHYALNRQVLEAIWKLKDDRESRLIYQEIENILKAGADPLYQESHDVIDAFHLFLSFKSKNPAVYKETQEVFLEKMQ